MEVLPHAFVISALVSVSEQLHAMAALPNRKVHPVNIEYNSQMNAKYYWTRFFEVLLEIIILVIVCICGDRLKISTIYQTLGGTMYVLCKLILNYSIGYSPP